MYNEQELDIMRENLGKIERFCWAKYMSRLKELGLTVTVPVARGRALTLYPDGNMQYRNGRSTLTWDRGAEYSVYKNSADMEELFLHWKQVRGRIEQAIEHEQKRRSAILDFEL